jgi:NAD(P)-dependent dehydrogenase (short-subunit alcohol dehydrogenase family)
LAVAEFSFMGLRWTQEIEETAMDLGIEGRRALVCAASRGLGRACALALAREGVAVTIVARGREALAARVATIQAGRVGDPTEFGAACAWLCSAQAGYITGQNLLLDGGAYPGTY